MADKDEVVKSFDKISDKLDAIDKTIREICAKPKEPEKNEEREFQLRLAKIQVYTDRCHALLSVRFSFVLLVFGLIVIFYPLYLQAVLSGNPYSNSGLVGFVGTFAIAIFGALFLRQYVRKYNNSLKRISNMIDVVRNGEDLPPLEKMDDWNRT